MENILIVDGKVLGMAAATDPLVVFGCGDLLASPPSRTKVRIALPVIFRVNLEVTLLEGE